MKTQQNCTRCEERIAVCEVVIRLMDEIEGVGLQHEPMLLCLRCHRSMKQFRGRMAKRHGGKIDNIRITTIVRDLPP